MTHSETEVAAHTRLEFDRVLWPASEPIAPSRVLRRAPEASTLRLHEEPGRELGLWRVTPGEFTTVHEGFTEFITIADGTGRLIHEDGTVIELRPRTVALLEDGWRGRWVVDTTIVKSYAVLDH